MILFYILFYLYNDIYLIFFYKLLLIYICMWFVIIHLVMKVEIIKFFILFFFMGLPQDFIHIISPRCTDIILIIIFYFL